MDIVKKIASLIISRIRHAKRLYEVRCFDRFRKKYDSLTFFDHRRLAKRWLRKFPEQAHFSPEPVMTWLDRFAPKFPCILEVGGWRGDLAKLILEKYKQIHVWHNFDLISDFSAQKCMDQRYRLIPLDDYLWNLHLKFEYNALIATHMIEHIKWNEFQKFAQWIPKNIFTVLFEAPLPISQENIDWSGDHSTHILEKGWKQIEVEMEKSSFRSVFRTGNTTVFLRNEA